MKKYFIILLYVLFYNIAAAQLLYTEHFDNLTIGNVGTDITGTVTGKGNWYTETKVGQASPQHRSFCNRLSNCSRSKQRECCTDKIGCIKRRMAAFFIQKRY